MTLKNKKIGIIALIAIAAITVPIVAAIHIPFDVEYYCDNITINNNVHKFEFMCDFAVDHEQRLDVLESITVVNGTDGATGPQGIQGEQGVFPNVIVRVVSSTGLGSSASGNCLPSEIAINVEVIPSLPDTIVERTIPLFNGNPVQNLESPNAYQIEVSQVDQFDILLFCMET